MTTRVVTLEPRARAAVSVLLREAQVKLQDGNGGRWSYARIAEDASTALRELSSNPGTTAYERRLWESLEVTEDHVRTLMNCPANPTGTDERRAVLLGVCLALNVDLAAMNRHAGGIAAPASEDGPGP